MKSRGTVPVISPWLHRIAVRRIARRAAAGDLPAVRELAAVFCTFPDPGARDLAGKAFRLLKSQDQIDLLCHESLLWDNDDLVALATGCGYLPAAPADRALWLFCASRTGIGEYLPLLAAGYAGAKEPLRARARHAARRDGTCSTLARALAGSNITQNAARWSYPEWEVVMAGFSEKGQEDDLWLLAPLAPLRLATEAIRLLITREWTPQGDDHVLWEALARSLPDCRPYPLFQGQPRAPVVRTAAQVVRLCLSPDGSLLVTGCRDGMIAVRRTASAGSAAEFPAGPGGIRFLAVSTDNMYLVCGREDGTVHGYSLPDHVRIWSWERRRSAEALVLSPDSRSVLIGDETGSLHVLGIRDGRVLSAIPFHPSPVTCIAAASGGSPVACGHADGTVSVADPADPGTLRHLSSKKTPVRSLSFFHAGTEILAFYEQASPVLWNLVTETKARVFSGHAGRASCSAVSVEGGWFATGSDDHMLRCWNTTKPAPAIVLPLYNRQLTCCSTVPDGSLFATCFHDGTIRICRMPGAELLRECRGDKKTITSCAMSPDGTRLATVSWDGTVRLWRLPEGEIVRTQNSHAGGIVSLAGPAGTLIASVTDDGVARVLDGSDGTLVRTIDLYSPSVHAAAMSADGSYLASAGTDASVRIWVVRDGSLAAAADPFSTSQRCCTFHPDGSLLVTGGWDGACRLLRVPDAKLLRTLPGHTSVVTCCTVSRDGSLLITGSNDTTVRLWRTADDKAYAVLRGSRSEVGAVALSPDETLLAAGSADGMIRLWRLPYGTPAGELPGLPGKVTSLAFTPDGCILAAGYDRGICTIVSLPEKAILQTILAHTGAVTGTAILPDKRTLVTTGADGVCRFHFLPLAPFLIHAGLADIPVAAAGEASARGSAGHGPWAFLLALLATRFRGEIGICPPLDVAGCYDIQIVG